MRAINSVLNQTYKNYELIVVDDGSTDNTESILLPFIESQKIKYLKQQNYGVSMARNVGVDKANGEWIAFLDSDDEWLPNKLLDQITFIQNNTTYKIIYGQEVWIRNGRKVNQSKHHQKSGGWIFDKCVQQCIIAPSSVLLKKEIFDEMGGFDNDFTVCEDYDLWLKISSLYEVGYISKPIIIKYGGHDDQLSTKFFAMDMWRLQALHRILKIRDLSIENKENVIETMKKKGAILIQGFQKHGNIKSLHEVEEILKMIEFS
jgi:glycosyltransferase involved in cell wall biosynthesis